MSYFTGTVTSLSELKNVIEAACQTDGWLLHNGILSKGKMYVKLSVENVNVMNGAGSGQSIFLYGGTGQNETITNGQLEGVLTGQAEIPVCLGTRMNNNVVSSLIFPLIYHIFSFENEVFIVIRYGNTKFQRLAFGQSIVNGLKGSGNWISGSLSRNMRNGTISMNGSFSITSTSGGSSSAYTSGAMFYNTQISGSSKTDMLDHGFDQVENWSLYSSSTAIGISALVPLIGLLPNDWNSEAVLLPIRAYVIRPQSKVSLVADLENARHTRIDHFEPGQIITLGNDKWMIFPWIEKNTSVRNGGTNIDHSGTFGWAVRYEGD